MTLTTRLFRLFSMPQSRSASGRAAIPRLDVLNLSNHDLADLNLPSYYRSRFDVERSLNVHEQHR